MSLTPSTAGRAPVRHASGFAIAGEHATYYDVLEPTAGAPRGTFVLVHGGAHTGACYLHTADGRPGWAHDFAERGYRVVVPDWPGTGRSGFVPTEQLDSQVVCAGIGAVIEAQSEPVILLTHSVSGGFGWSLLERYGTDIDKLVAVAPGAPANLQPPARILSRNGAVIEAQQAHGGTVFRLDLGALFAPSRALVDQKLIGSSSRFPAGCASDYTASLIGVPPRLIYERLNIGGDRTPITDFSHYVDKPILILVGTDDFDHPVEHDRQIATWCRERGARAEFLDLGAIGIHGNGHMPMLESNSDEVAAVIADWVEGALASAPS